MTDTTATAVISGIIDGEYDEDLRSIYEAVRSREKEVSRRRAEINRLTLTPGARVRLRGLSPKYLNGRTGTVVENTSRHRSAIAVKQDVYGIGGARDIETIYIPSQCVETIE